MLRMDPCYSYIVCHGRMSGRVAEVTFAHGILWMEMRVPQGEDLEFYLIHLSTCSYNKYLLSIRFTLGAGDKVANQT